MIRILLILCSLLPISLFAQGGISIGVNYGHQQDLDKEFNLEQNVYSRFQVNKDYYGVNVSYYAAKRLNMVSEIGVSVYTPEVQLANYVVTNINTASLKSTNLYLQQQIGYDVFELPEFSDYFGIRLTPFVQIKYEQSLGGRTREKGISDLNGAEATALIQTYDMPAMNYIAKAPVNTMSLTPGINLEVSVVERLGFNVEFGYQFGLFGHSKFDVNYRYTGKQPSSATFKSRDRGIYLSGGLRYYL